MNLNQTSPASEVRQTTNNVPWLVGAIPALLFAGSELIALRMGHNSQLWVILPIFVAVPVAYWLIRAGRNTLANALFIAAIGLQSILLSLVQKGAGVPNALTALALIVAIGLGTLPRKYIRHAFIAGLLVAFVSVAIDLLGSSNRPVALFSEGRWIFSIAMLTLFGVFLARQLFSLDIRTKIVTGILGAVALALVVFIFFTLNQTQQVTNALSARLETSVRQLAEEQLANTASMQANQADQSFKDVEQEVVSLAQNWSSLHNQRDVVSRRTYWDASANLVQLPGGQYGNSSIAPSSIFIPTRVSVNDALVVDLNTSAYLDFYAPAVMKVNPSLLAVYAVDTRGVIRRYPNNNLAYKLAPDSDETKKPYYSITVPLLNPQRLPRWIVPYADETSGELFVTVAAPVYDKDEFIGIMAADMQLASIAEQINALKIGETGYAYMLDDAGHIISMPQAGFDMFGIRPEDINAREFYNRSVEDSGTLELKSLTKRMMAGGSGLLVVDVNGVKTYISFAPVKANGYSVALVVPVSELQGAIASARNQTQQQIQATLQTAIFILILLLIVAITVSLVLGQIIAAPIQRLTLVAAEIAGGDLSAQADVRTKDEIGTLASSFNTMTARLRETLSGLEHRVEERTAELLSANEKNERRARQFESIAQVARTISSTRNLDALLPQITAVISREFNFYHIGIFLLDAAKGYAILSAANSDGGQIMLKRGHRLKVGEKGIVGYVTGSGKPRVALDTGADAIFFNNPDLPDTHSEIALPLRAGEEIIGALDVQSTEPGAFSQEDINILSTLADQVSVAIQNAQQFEQTRKALSEAETLAKQFAQTGWQQFTQEKNLIGIHHTGAKATLLYERKANEKESESLGMVQSRKKSRGAFLSLPIELRGEAIGSVDVRSPDNRPWDQDELDIVTAIIERAAIAMENARLLEESQRLASKEAKIGAVTAKISASINMRNVLQTAVEELGRALPGSEVMIQFETDQNKNKATS